MTYGMTNDIKPGAPGGLASFSVKPFETVLVHELIPYVDSHFRTLADRNHRAMAGLSMGGFETKAITTANVDKFAYVGLFSGGTFTVDDVAKAPGFRDKMKLAFVSFGSRELAGRRTAPPGIAPADPAADAKALKASGFNSVFYVSPNTAHEFLSWRRSLHEFAPLLFRD
jgi:S-formylglutathione hydrolase FrmB